MRGGHVRSWSSVLLSLDSNLPRCSGKLLEYLQTLFHRPKDPWTLRKQALPSVAPGTLKCPWLSWHNPTAGKGLQSKGPD